MISNVPLKMNAHFIVLLGIIVAYAKHSILNIFYKFTPDDILYKTLIVSNCP